MTAHPEQRDMNVAVQLGSLAVSINAEGVSWSPDVATDMSARVMDMLREALAEAHAYGLLQTDSEVTFDDGEFAETTTGEDEDGE